MPELPEVEILVRRLAPRLKNKTIRGVEVCRERVLRPTRPAELERALIGARFLDLARRAKYLRFTLRRADGEGTFLLLGHLGMTGRMFLQPASAPLPKHTAVALKLGAENFVFEDTRYFGRFTLDNSTQEGLGPEPLGDEFTIEYFTRALKRSAQAIKVKLIDQALVAGLGNIYACEALFHAGVSPRLAARKLTRAQAERLRSALRATLAEAIHFGTGLGLDLAGTGQRDGLFYYGRAAGAPDQEERLYAYDREAQPCWVCQTPIRRIVQAARSTFYCPRCQRT
jgi:formamidopyrimidine-DNA glycosylase